VNKRTIGIKLDAPFRLLKGITHIGIILQFFGNFFCRLIGEFADDRGRQMNATEFLQIFFGEAIGEKLEVRR
jgi:hypothetical protein